ncbi:MAG: hypothetical protein N2C12_12970 [Planctomycetales bacterium]
MSHLHLVTVAEPLSPAKIRIRETHTPRTEIASQRVRPDNEAPIRFKLDHQLSSVQTRSNFSKKKAARVAQQQAAAKVVKKSNRAQFTGDNHVDQIQDGMVSVLRVAGQPNGYQRDKQKAPVTHSGDGTVSILRVVRQPSGGSAMR